MDDINDSGLWTKAFRYYEQLSAIIDLEDSRLWAQGSRCFDNLRLWLT